MNAKTLTLALLCAFALAAPAVAAPPKAAEEDDKIVLQNDHVTVWFQGKKPMLKVIPAANASEGDNASGAYSYKFTDVVEYRDLDGDGAPSDNEVVASLNLDKASAWTVERTEAEGLVTLNLTLAGVVKLGPKADKTPLPGGGPNLSLPDREAAVGLVFTLREGAATIQAGDANVSVPATSVKYDFVLAKWPYVGGANTRLALVAHVQGDLEAAVDGDVETATVAANESAVGVLSWLPTADGLDAEGKNVTVPVKTVLKPDAEGFTRLVHTYDAPGLASFVHDPTIGVTPTEESLEPSETSAPQQGGGANKVPAPAAALALLGVAVVATLLRRRG